MNLVWFMVLKFLKAPPQADRNFRTTTLDQYGFKLNHEVVHKAMKLIANYGYSVMTLKVITL